LEQKTHKTRTETQFIYFTFACDLVGYRDSSITHQLDNTKQTLIISENSVIWSVASHSALKRERSARYLWFAWFACLSKNGRFFSSSVFIRPENLAMYECNKDVQQAISRDSNRLTKVIIPLSANSSTFTWCDSR